jgi:hypothetical protein
MAVRKLRCWCFCSRAELYDDMWVVSRAEMVCSTSSWVVRVSESTPSEGEGVQGEVRTGWGRLMSYIDSLGEQQHLPEVAIRRLVKVK